MIGIVVDDPVAEDGADRIFAARAEPRQRLLGVGLLGGKLAGQLVQRLFHMLEEQAAVAQPDGARQGRAQLHQTERQDGTGGRRIEQVAGERERLGAGLDQRLHRSRKGAPSGRRRGAEIDQLGLAPQRADPLAAWSRERHQTHALEPHAESDTIGARWFERAEQGRAHQA